MQKRKLGAAGPEVSAVGIGAMSFSTFYGPVDEAEAFGVLDAARDLGVDHLDTSNIYGMGQSEATIGRWLARHGSARHDLFRIATKAGVTRDLETGERRFDNSRAHLESELDASLRRLGLDRVDLFYVHRRDAATPVEEVTETLQALVRAGKIGAFGFSEIAPTTLARACAVAPVAAVQSEYSLQTRQPDLGLRQACGRLGVALVAFSPVGRGLLTDRPPSAESLRRSPFLAANPRFAEGALAANLAASDALRRLAAEAGLPTAALAIAWVLAQSPEVIAIPGTRSAAHLRELALGGGLVLEPDLRQAIDAALPPGWATGDRYSDSQYPGVERFC